MLDTSLANVASITNKSDLSIRVDSFPPLALLWADWRAGNYCTFDFGFGTPEAYRHFFGGVPVCQAIVFPPRLGGVDEGMEIMFSCEKEIARDVVNDGEWGKYMEYRGVDVDVEEEEEIKAKL
jgi:hypothetical protein